MSTPEQLLSEFARECERTTGWGAPTFDRHPESAEDAFALMEHEINHLEEAWGDMRRRLEKKVSELKARPQGTQKRGGGR